jgi:PEP-CTERM motif
MRFSLSRLIVGIVAAGTLLFFAPTRAKADTHQILGLGIDNVDIYGINGDGSVVLYTGTFVYPGCTPGGLFCYATYVDGVRVSASNTPPTIIDNGAPAGPGCPALPAFNPLPLRPPPAFDLCNNGHEAYGVEFHGSFADGNDETGVFFGPDPVKDAIIGGNPVSGGPLTAMMNSFGDFVYDEAGLDEIIEVYDVTSHDEVPEPGSLILLATGAIAGAFTFRRRFA